MSASHRMKAIVYDQYGTPDVLRLEEVERPTPKPNEVRVQVRAASVNSWDWDMLRGKPFIIRLLWGLFAPNHQIPGADVAGVVEAVGRDVKGFAVGDEVFGDLCESGWGGFAEFVCAHEKSLVRKPDALSFEQAAAIPQAGVMALQGIRDDGQTEPGQRVLVNGAGGGVGAFAIQLAKSYGAEVTGVDRGDKLEFMRELGADHVLDYEQEDFTKRGETYDVILDVALHRSIWDGKRALSPKGRYIVVGGDMSRVFHALAVGPLVSRSRGRKLGILAHQPNKNLTELGELCGAGKLKPAIDRQYKLSEARTALQYIGEGNAKGKVIIQI